MNVHLDDDEVVELIMERPHLIGKAIEKLQADLADANETSNTLSCAYHKLRRESLSTPQATDSGVDLDPPMKRI